jgi:stringent starvation protein B
MTKDDAQEPEQTDGQAPLLPIKPYLIRAWHQWCTDQGFAPHLVIQMSATVRAPREYVRDGQLVLNVSYDATDGLKMDNDWIEFSARFGGVVRDIACPVGQVLAIYARENGQGMGFEIATPSDQDAVSEPQEPTPAHDSVDPPSSSSPSKGLRRVK